LRAWYKLSRNEQVAMKLLSVIVPFHNSALKCSRLIQTLVRCSDPDVEVVCVDDGSRDSTLEILSEFKLSAACTVKVIVQKNKGPGGARNNGLDASEGQYIWFVDSDDDIQLDVALRVLRKNQSRSPDFIDFNIESGGRIFGSTNLSPGIYAGPEAAARSFGRICSKIFHRRMFQDTGVRYPDYCIYEDNALLFMLPLYTKSFIVVSECVYIHHEEYESITRGERSCRYFDRMMTASWGLAMSLQIDASLSDVMEAHFVRLYLINTGKITAVPSRFWFEKLRVMRQFRTDARRLGVYVGRAQVSTLLSKASKKYRFVFWMLYLLSAIFPSQTAFFQKMRMKAWGRPFMPPCLTVVRPE